jgi:probable HAF family extracellular repeat protein
MKRILRNVSISIFALVLCAANSGPALAAGWTITDLGLGSATDINNSGQIVGVSNDAAVIWSSGNMTSLGTLGGAYSYAQGINNVGQVVGYSDGLGPSSDYMPFLWSNGTMTQLSQPGNGGLALAINDSGLVVGFSIAAASAAYWSNGTQYLFPNTYCSAHDVNNSGQIVAGAFLWDNGTAIPLNPFVDAVAINDASQVVGITSDERAALWSNGNVTDIGPALYSGSVSQIFDINNAGQVVGAGLLDNNSPYLWDNGTVIDLNSLVNESGWTLSKAYGINDLEYIVGEGIFNGQMHAFLLTPDYETPAPVPEPSTIFLLGTGIAGFAGIRIFKRKSSPRA